MQLRITYSPGETIALGAEYAKTLTGRSVTAFIGGMGMGKTTFVRGMAQGLLLPDEVASPTFALVHDYGGSPPLVHLDMYRIGSFEDLQSVGFYEYLDAGAMLVVEWSENVLPYLPRDTRFIRITAPSERERRFEIDVPFEEVTK